MDHPSASESLAASAVPTYLLNKCMNKAELVVVVLLRLLLAFRLGLASMFANTLSSAMLVLKEGASKDIGIWPISAENADKLQTASIFNNSAVHCN